MGRRFRGEGLHKVDSKGRVSIPALFRRVIESCDPNWKEGLPPELIIVYGDERRKFIECYTIEAIEEVAAFLSVVSAHLEINDQRISGPNLPSVFAYIYSEHMQEKHFKTHTSGT